ncbi:integral membrane protein 2B-like, partial [Sinocyclocheilus rhinocerous]
SGFHYNTKIIFSVLNNLSVSVSITLCVILCCQKLTAYLDLNLDRCYIITLNTSIVMPPRDFHEFLVNIKAGMYLPQTYLMREEMMVTERLDSTSDLGYYINDLCKDKDTYRLQRRDIILGMQKREALNCHKIRHFENKFVVETLICEP